MCLLLRYYSYWIYSVIASLCIVNYSFLTVFLHRICISLRIRQFLDSLSNSLEVFCRRQQFAFAVTAVSRRQLPLSSIVVVCRGLSAATVIEFVTLLLHWITTSGYCVILLRIVCAPGICHHVEGACFCNFHHSRP